MYHLKLCKGLSYYGMGGALKATRQQPDVLTEDKAIADAAVASGFFKLVGEGEAPHAWFAGFLRNEDAPYAFVVLVEHGGGSAVAGGVAGRVLDVIVNGYAK